MSCGLNPEDFERLKSFIAACQKKPQILWLPELIFFREYIESLGGAIPKPEPAAANVPEPESKTKTDDSSTPMEDDAESEESEVELDNEGVLEPETLDPPEMGDQSREVNEDDEMAASAKRAEAQVALSEGDLDKAVDLFTEAIKLNPHSAIMYAKRANILIKQKRVKAALRDCDEALNLNPDSATAHKFRGRVERLLGNWLEAAKDLRLACKLDFDEEANEWLKEVEPNVLKLEEHKRKRERKKHEKEQKDRAERVRKAKEEYEKAQKAETKKPSNPFGGMPGGMPGGGNIGDIFNDPEIMIAMQDPEVAAAFQEISMNPSPETIFKIQSNPKIAPVFEKIMKKFGGGGGMPGGFPGGMPGGFPGGIPGGMPGGFPGGMPGGFPGGMPGGFPGGPPPPSPPRDDLD